jgi:hypothetical protein
MSIQTLWPGKAGALQTLQQMRELIIEAIQSQEPRRIIDDLIRGGFSLSSSDLAYAVRSWLLLHVILVDEYEEVLISPRIMLNNIADLGTATGDCDDMTMLAASLLASAGAQIQLVACFPQPDGSYGHVFCRYLFPNQSAYVDFDPTIGYNVPSYPGDVLTLDVIS